MNSFVPRVVDISHHNTVRDLHLAAAGGLWGVIHKSSQGRGYRDPDYATRRSLAKAAGLLWGAYHFNDGSDVATQVDWFIKCAAPDSETLMVLDFEDNKASNMTVQNAVKFLRLLEQKLGRKGAIYSGNRLKETIGQLNAADRAYLCVHRLWLCQYGPRAVLPKGFGNYWLWQYTGDGVGLQPHNIPGIKAGNAGLDLNVYEGDRELLAKEWAGSSSLAKDVISAIAGDPDVSSHSKAAEADQVEPFPPVASFPPADEHDNRPAPSVQDPAAVGDPDLWSVQRRLGAMNYAAGISSGVWGGMTAGALSAFINDRGGHIPAPTSLDMFDANVALIKRELASAEAEGFKRPVTAARKAGDAATVAKVAPEVVPVKRNFLTSAWAAVVTFLTAVGTTISSQLQTAWDWITNNKDSIPTDPGYLSMAWGYVGKVPTAVWIFLAAGGLSFIAWNSFKTARKITESVQSGARQ